MKSLKARLSVGILLSLGSLLALAGGGIAWTLMQSLRDTFDQSLWMRARLLASAVAQDDSQRPELQTISFEPTAPPLQESERQPREFVQLWSGDGRLIEHAILLSDGTPLRASGEIAAGHTELPRDVVPSTQPRFRDLLLPDGRPGRMVQWDFVPGSPVDTLAGTRPQDPTQLESSQRHRLATLLVAVERRSLNRRLKEVLAATVSALLILLGVVAFLVRKVVDQSLEPLRQISQQVQQVGVRNWKHIPSPTSAAELESVVQQLNALLERLQDAFERERRLSSNIAHELRTPIAELRSLAEVGSRWPDDQAMVLQFFGDVQDVAAQMEKTVTHLLALARYESGLEIVHHESVSIEPLVGQAWHPLRRQAASRSIQFQRQIQPSDILRSDPDKLQLILHNLLDNAVSYSPEGSTVQCLGYPKDDGWILAVVNPAPNLTPEDLPRLFDRFWRKDPSRTEAHHHGLGLSLVQAFVDLLGIELHSRLEDGKLHMELSFHADTSTPPTNGLH